MKIFLKHPAGALMGVEVREGNIIDLTTGNVESSEFAATIRLENGLEHEHQRPRRK